jgi:hypothetical protein
VIRRLNLIRLSLRPCAKRKPSHTDAVSRWEEKSGFQPITAGFFAVLGLLQKNVCHIEMRLSDDGRSGAARLCGIGPDVWMDGAPTIDRVLGDRHENRNRPLRKGPERPIP